MAAIIDISACPGIAVGPIDSKPLSITTGTWHQMITRRDGNKFDLFYDDLLVASTLSTNAITVSPNPLLWQENS